MLDCSQSRKAEELLWKKVFYEVIQKCRQNKTVSETVPHLLYTINVLLGIPWLV